jgi:hypothetical protein
MAKPTRGGVCAGWRCVVKFLFSLAGTDINDFWLLKLLFNDVVTRLVLPAIGGDSYSGSRCGTGYG